MTQPRNSPRGIVTSAWGEWLSTFSWEAWCTLTFREPFSDAASVRAWRRFERWLRGEHPALSYFVGQEHGSQGGRVHFHALMGGFEAYTSRRALWDWWFTRYGRAEVLPYDPERGAAHYITKYVAKELTWYDIAKPRHYARQVALLAAETGGEGGGADGRSSEGVRDAHVVGGALRPRFSAYPQRPQKRP